MTLRISLRDGERMVVNGAVVRATGRVNLCVENTATILRGRDVMTAEEANTPARLLYFACMMAYIDPDNAARHRDAIVSRIGDLMGALESPEAKRVCIAFAQKAALLDFYGALTDCRWLIAYEAEAMARIPAAAE
ncbi:flagellar biosynthesis repressor FlbT [Sphingomonas quercus]|uniref:Flagellar biosynthesis repressor FlbT n=1 Tax=Sphingomonas quercus TaxID=2842451 RepID=A0ABS6BKF5_9SPHN|nr:flagellar biosynthesis repressor FlbT [Sphingomonas quercus]MBU3078649.1 flagellar biosynthesis repressor FlbT [Sphingomonas quercus]